LIEEANALPFSQEQRNRWQTLNRQIAKTNLEAIDSSWAVVAVLDGTDVDSGTACEVGYAYAKGKKLYGYRGDFRLSADNIGSTVNLQVEYCFKNHGGIALTLDTLCDNLRQRLLA
jgi:nucleoside 2-deoxyribosyltransferase